MPDAKTMVRLGQVMDGPTLQHLLRRLVTIATATGVTKGKKMRVDTTVVEAPIHHPTDSGLCEDVVRVLSRAMRRLAEAPDLATAPEIGSRTSVSDGSSSLYRLGCHCQ